MFYMYTNKLLIYKIRNSVNIRIEKIIKFL